MRARERLRGLLRVPQLAFRLGWGGTYDFTYDQMPIRLQGMSFKKRLNLMRAGLNLVHRRFDPWSKPLHIQVELVNYCQLRCPVCPTGTGELRRPAQRMDPGLFRLLMQDVGPGLLTMSLWAWGESLLHPSLAEFLEEARRYNAAIFLSTNGQNLDREDVVAAIVEHPPTFLIVAIDGLTHETNSRFRVGARLEPALAGVKKIAEARKGRLPILQMRFIVMKHNEHELERIARFASKNHFEHLTLRQLAVGGSETEIRNYKELRPENPDYRASQPRNGRFPNSFVCMQPYWFPSVFADGTLVFCEQDHDGTEPLGRLSQEETFSDLWFGSKARQTRKKLHDNPEAISFCRTCSARERKGTDTSFESIWLHDEIERPVRAGG